MTNNLFRSSDPAFSEKVYKFAFEIWLEVLMGRRSNSIIDKLFTKSKVGQGSRLKAMKKRLFKLGYEWNHHYAWKLTVKRLEKLDIGYETDISNGFEAEKILKDFFDLPAPIAFESKYIMETNTLRYRIWEYVYGAKSREYNSCLIILYDALNNINWEEVRSIEAEVSFYLKTKIMDFSVYSRRKIPHEAIKYVHRLWSGDRPTLNNSTAAGFLNIERINAFNENIKGKRVSLLVGAGTTVSAGGPSWTGLINRLWLNELRGRYSYPTLSDKNAVSEVSNVISDSVLIQARMLKRICGPGFIHKVRHYVYKGVNESSEAPASTSRLAKRLYEANQLHKVITFNYDNLIEHNLKSLNVLSLPRFQHDRLMNIGITVEHVHGYLPPDPEQISDDEANSVVFDEETYHSRFNIPNHWTNRTLISAFEDSVCVFIGFSMTDPNVRRLLEEQAKTSEAPHYLLLRLPSMSGDQGDDLLARARLIHTQQEMMSELGLNIIWYEKYDDLPVILDLMVI